MPGILRCALIDLNDEQISAELLEVLATEASMSSNLHRLKVQGRYYFNAPEGSIPSSAGWYIICDGKRRPIYVGKAQNLNKRLNTLDGSRDNFANPKRTKDPVRNFIKVFATSNLIQYLLVITICEDAICLRLGINPPLSRLDRDNIEKVLGLLRDRVVYRE